MRNRNLAFVVPLIAAAALAAQAGLAQQSEPNTQPNGNAPESNAAQGNAAAGDSAETDAKPGSGASRSESNAAENDTDIALADKGENTDTGADNPDVDHMHRCIQLQRIDHTDVIDDSTILFYMRDGTILRNNLPLRCPDLKNQDRFMYRVSLPQLCDIDVITVLNDIGGRFLPGASCGLGKFQEISKDAVDEIKRVAERTEKEKRK